MTRPFGWFVKDADFRREAAACPAIALDVAWAHRLERTGVCGVPFASGATSYVSASYDRGLAYAIIAALCAEGVAPELDLPVFPESPDVSGLASEILRSWSPEAEARYAAVVRTWLETWRATDRAARARRLLTYLRRREAF